MNVICFMLGHKPLYNNRVTAEFLVGDYKVDMNVCSRCEKAFLRTR